MKPIGRGARGKHVRDIQARLAALGHRIDAEEVGVYGESTERAARAFQQQRQLLVDGLVGEDTWQELVEAGHALGDRVLYLRSPYFRGDDVRALQRWLNLLGFDSGREDGIFGERTDRAVREFQRNVGLPPDGIVGPASVTALTRLRPVGQGPGRATVREAEALRHLAASLEGARIAIDPGHGGDDPGEVGPTGLTEAEVTALLARALAHELTSRGAEPFLLREGNGSVSNGERAQRANGLGAEVCLSLHLNAHRDPRADGASSYYFGLGSYVSPAGQRLAELIQEELVARLRVNDGRAHPKALPLLRETRMPAVHVEPCFITNPDEERRLREESFRGEIAAALADALERFMNARAPGTRSEARGVRGGPRGSTAGAGGDIERRPAGEAVGDSSGSAVGGAEAPGEQQGRPERGSEGEAPQQP